MKRVALVCHLSQMLSAAIMPNGNAFDARGKNLITLDLLKRPADRIEQHLAAQDKDYDEEMEAQQRRSLQGARRSEEKGLELTNYINNQYYATFLFGSTK